MQQNHAIAVIIIVLFVVITGLSYGIYRLIQAGRADGGTTATESSLADDDDSSLAPLVVPPFVPGPVVPPGAVPQRVVRRPPVPRVPPPRDGSVSPVEADPLAPRPLPNPPPPPSIVQRPAPQPRPVARRRNQPQLDPPAPPPPPPPVQPSASQQQPIPPPPPSHIIQPVPLGSRPRRNPRSPPLVQQAPALAGLEVPPRDGSVSSLDADPLRPRRPGPGPPSAPPAGAPLADEPVVMQPMPGGMPDDFQQQEPLLEGPHAWGMPPELHDYQMPAELEAHGRRIRAVSPSGTLTRHRRQRERPTLAGWVGGQMPGRRRGEISAWNPWTIPAW